MVSVRIEKQVFEVRQKSEKKTNVCSLDLGKQMKNSIYQKNYVRAIGGNFFLLTAKKVRKGRYFKLVRMK